MEEAYEKYRFLRDWHLSKSGILTWVNACREKYSWILLPYPHPLPNFSGRYPYKCRGISQHLGGACLHLSLWRRPGSNYRVTYTQAPAMLSHIITRLPPPCAYSNYSPAPCQQRK